MESRESLQLKMNSSIGIQQKSDTSHTELSTLNTVNRHTQLNTHSIDREATMIIIVTMIIIAKTLKIGIEYLYKAATLQ